MNVVHLSTVHSDNDTRIVEKECKGLAARGYNVSLLIPAEVSEIREGVNVVALPRIKNRFIRITVGSLVALRRAWSFRADVYHFHDPELIPVGLVLSLRSRLVVYDMHENVPEQIKHKSWIPRVLRNIFSTLIMSFERLVLNRFYVVMAEDSYLAAYPWIKKKVAVLNFPKVEALRKIRESKRKNEYPTLGYIGGITEHRGAFVMLRIVKAIRDNGLPVKLVLVGPIDTSVANSDEFKVALDEGWLDHRGRLPPKDGWAVMASCEIGLALLQPVGNYVESYPTKMFEYMALGLPVVVSKFPLYQSVIEKHKCGICVDPFEVESTADAIHSLLVAETLKSNMANNGIRAATEFYSWERQLDILVEVYKSS
ncbi:MAG: glycosyltransferase [Pseudohongiellaceae bacterium]